MFELCHVRVCTRPCLPVTQPNSDSETSSSNICHPHTPHISLTVLSERGHVNMIAVVDHNEHMPWSLQEVLSCGFPDLNQEVIFQDLLFPCEMNSVKTPGPMRTREA